MASASADAATLDVAIEISRKRPVAGLKSPLCEKIGTLLGVTTARAPMRSRKSAARRWVRRVTETVDGQIGCGP